MGELINSRICRSYIAVFFVMLLVSACATSKISKVDPKYGVSASKRVYTTQRKRMPRGGGVRRVGKKYTIAGKVYTPRNYKSYNRVGYASWYGRAFHGRRTANGEIYDMNSLSAAHPTLPLPSYVRVTNLSKGRSVIVRVNDRGPFARSRIIDLSKRAATVLGTIKQGVAKVRVEYLGRAPLHARDEAYLYASIRGTKIPAYGKQVVNLAKNNTYRETKAKKLMAFDGSNKPVQKVKIIYKKPEMVISPTTRQAANPRQVKSLSTNGQAANRYVMNEVADMSRMVKKVIVNRNAEPVMKNAARVKNVVVTDSGKLPFGFAGDNAEAVYNLGDSAKQKTIPLPLSRP